MTSQSLRRTFLCVLTGLLILGFCAPERVYAWPEPVPTSKAPAKKKKKGSTKPASSGSQSKKKKSTKPRTSGDVRREKKKTAAEIEQAKQEIQANKRRTRRQLNRLGELDRDINVSAASLAALQSRVDALRRRISALEDTVKANEERVERLRDAYGRTLTQMRRQRQGMSELAFIFSSDNFSQMSRRARYLGELGRAHSAKARVLRAELDTLQIRHARLDSMRVRLQQSIASQQREHRRLSQNRQQASMLVDSLKREGASLQEVLSEKQAQARRLDAELDRIIAEEARRAAEEEARRKAAEEEARRKAAEAAAQAAAKNKKNGQAAPGQNNPPASKPKPQKPSTPAAQPGAVDHNTGNSFEAQKGKLPAPVDRPYRISSEFGRNAHPELSRIEVQNNGMDLRCGAGTHARAVFKGIVSSIFRLDGYSNIVILRHGSYLTVYAGLENLTVRKGQEVKAGTLLGTIHPDPDENGACVLHFEIRHEKEKLNPALWLRH